MQNASKGAILQAMTENSNVNAATLQALQHTTVVAAVDRLSKQCRMVKTTKLQLYLIFRIIVVQ